MSEVDNSAPVAVAAPVASTASLIDTTPIVPKPTQVQPDSFEVRMATYKDGDVGPKLGTAATRKVTFLRHPGGSVTTQHGIWPPAPGGYNQAQIIFVGAPGRGVCEKVAKPLADRLADHPDYLVE